MGAEFVAGFALGAIMPWLTLAVMSAIVIIALEFENGVLPAMTIIATVLFFNFVLGYGVLPYLLSINLLMVPVYVLVYMGLGVAWSFFKWGVFVDKMTTRINQTVAKFVKANRLPNSELTPEQKLDFEQYYYHNNSGRKLDRDVPDHTTHKALLASWAVYWPWSVMWFILNDPLRRLYNLVYRFVEGVYGSITEKFFGKVRKNVLLSDVERDQLMEAKRAAEEAARRERDQERGGMRR